MPVGWQYDATVMWGGVAGISSAFGRRGALHDRDDPEAQIDEDGWGKCMGKKQAVRWFR